MNGPRLKAGPAVLALLTAGLLLLPSSAFAKKDAEKEKDAGKAPPAAAAPVAGQPTGSGNVALVGGVPISESELNEQAANQLSRLRAQEYDIKRRVLDDLIIRKLLEKEAASRNISVDELNRVEIEAKAPAVTEDEKKTFYQANKARFGDKPEADVMKMIEPGLRQQRINQRRSDYINELKAKASVKVLLEPPRIQVDVGNAAAKGPREAPVTIVEFSDYQ